VDRAPAAWSVGFDARHRGSLLGQIHQPPRRLNPPEDL